MGIRIEMLIRSLNFRPKCCILATSSTMLCISSVVSLGSPTIKYNLRFAPPLSRAAASIFNIVPSEILLLMTRRNLSLPASGAKVNVILRCEANKSISFTAAVFRRRLGKDKVKLSPQYRCDSLATSSSMAE